MTKILFICHGNICRSAMAKFILQDMVDRAGSGADFYIDSAAVSRGELGNPIYPPARRELEKHGICSRGHRARQVTGADYDSFDRIYYMDRSNARYLAALLPPDPQKIRPLLDRDVADPWYTGDFSKTYQDLVEGCRAILEAFSC